MWHRLIFYSPLIIKVQYKGFFSSRIKIEPVKKRSYLAECPVSIAEWPNSILQVHQSVFFSFHEWWRCNICRAFKKGLGMDTKAKFTLVLASWVSIKYVTCSFDVSETSKWSTTHVNQWHIVTFSLTSQNRKTYHSECKTDVVLLTCPQSSGSVQACVKLSQSSSQTF